MIKRFRSNALRDAFRGELRRITPNLRQRVTDILDALENAQSLADLENVVGFHSLSGDRAGTYAVTLTRNHRITFVPEPEGDVFHVSRVDIEDYH